MRRQRLTIVITAAITFAITVLLCAAAVFLPKGAGYLTKLSKINRIIERSYVGDYEPGDLVDGAAWGMVAALGDPYSSYLDEETLQSYTEIAQGEYEGVGIEIYIDEADNLMTVLAPFEGSPGDRAGLLPGDKIIQIDEMPVSGVNFLEAVDYMRGRSEEGKKARQMTLSVLRRGADEPLQISLAREKIEMHTISQKQFGDVSYIRISGFDSNTARDFAAALDGIDTVKTRGLVVDLRDNPGGLYGAAVGICDMLLDAGLIVYTEDKSGKQRKEFSSARFFDMPLALLINENSASASEIVAGAVKDRGRGALVGQKSFGKGVVQEIKPLYDKTAVKVTIARYFTPSGRCIDKLGIEPDVPVALGEGAAAKSISRLEYQEDAQLIRAVELLRAK